MNALANEEVGRYLGRHFVASYQKVGTFRIGNGQKQGGNVASYFCLPDGRVLHAVAGPVDAEALLREARWVVDTEKLARLAGSADALPGAFRKAHAERLRQRYGLDLDAGGAAADPVATFAAAAFDRGGKRARLDRQGQVHLLLAAFPLARLDKVYAVVFEKILGEKVSTLPVES